MKLGELYRKAIETGIANEWRGQECIDAIFAKAREDASKPDFDEDRLWNPFGDTRIAFGDIETKISSVLVGIDIRPSDVLLAAQMRQAGKVVDLVLSHHTSCINRGLYYYEDVMISYKYALDEVGVPRDKYEQIVNERIANVAYCWKMDVTNAARNLDIPLMNIHTPCDWMFISKLRETLERMKDSSLADIAAALNEVEEVRTTPYEEFVVHGDSSAKPGKVYDALSGGWTPPVEMIELAFEASTDTMVICGSPEDHLQAAQKHGVNVLSIPHDSTDCWGINLMLDGLQTLGLGPLTVYETDNFKRVTRT